ncbi:hypothetical protein EJ02DRAFT_447808 [Clathrospora elynae]|uniref:Fork-head domain-containing protein n=1 Tax=Clathrospora elynae TaxID=706981 RepID=A0A6A5SBC8_9PLEO|nr:hypothetical protein EJ02DRAFT_447808 [Clathrospora elynae]
MMEWAAPTNFLLNPMDQNGTAYHNPNSFPPSSGDFYHYAQNGLSYNDNYNLPYSTQYPSSSCPRSYNGPDLTGMPIMGMTESYPPTAYHIEPPKHHDAMDLSDHEINGQLMQLSNDCEHNQYGSHIKTEDHSGYQSPYSDLTRASTPHDDPSRHPHDSGSGEGGAIDKEQPYAQLIYQALLHAPNKTMILRDIYDWFKNHTDKASASETKGWQNSIRHNLSMNGAFEKVDQPCEESRKGFMWRLTEEAIREGVKSTTRYRSKQPNKRGHRTQQPQPQRQASGAKGGQAARRSARMKRSGRIHGAYRNDAYISRSVPAAFDPSYHGPPDSSLRYPPSPYYGSEVDFHYSSPSSNHNKHRNSDNDFGSPSLANSNSPLDLFPPPPRSAYTHSPMMGGAGLPITGNAYVLDHSPTESLFTNSPSPSADEPRTPASQGGWLDEGGVGATCVFDEQLAYREYAG